MAAVIRVTQIEPRSMSLNPVVVPVARIDTVDTTVIAEYLENEFTPTPRTVTRITKVNGDHILAAESLGVVESLIAHAGRN